MMKVVTTGAVRRTKLQTNHHNQQTNTQLFTGQMPFLSPNQQRQSTEGKKYHIPWTCSPQLTWGSSNRVFDHQVFLVTLGMVAEPLVSPLTPVPHNPS